MASFSEYPPAPISGDQEISALANAGADIFGPDLDDILKLGLADRLRYLRRSENLRET